MRLRSLLLFSHLLKLFVAIAGIINNIVEAAAICVLVCQDIFWEPAGPLAKLLFLNFLAAACSSLFHGRPLRCQHRDMRKMVLQTVLLRVYPGKLFQTRFNLN